MLLITAVTMAADAAAAAAMEIAAAAAKAVPTAAPDKKKGPDAEFCVRSFCRLREISH